MSIIYILIVIIVVGVLLWLINTYLPMEPVIKRVFNIVVIVAFVVWLLKVLGFWAFLGSIRV